MSEKKSAVLKLCIFATGLSGIVAEYILATLATYFIGDSVVQWALIISMMMFSMGIGSRISKYIQNNLLISFITIEFLLSLLVSFSSLIAYSAASLTESISVIIYSMSISIGLLIGLEIPLVIRLNEEFETLRLNVSAVMERDYYGSLLGGLFFVFIGMPYLGLTYTPFILGGINFIVAIALFITTFNILNKKEQLKIFFILILTTILIISGSFFSKPVILFAEQAKYKDKIVFETRSKYQRIIITEWKGNYWLYINGNQQLSSLDEALYHEPLVHPVVGITPSPRKVLVIGGGDGCAVRELLKYKMIKNITLVDLDPVMTTLAKKSPILLKMNDSSLYNKKVKVINQDGFKFLETTESIFDVIIIDLPDPRDVELARLYSVEFFNLCKIKLSAKGSLITQATSPYYSQSAYRCIERTVNASGFSTAPLHNQILTMGEWGWIIGTKSCDSNMLINRLRQLNFKNIKTEWINNDAMLLITSFGKNFYSSNKDSIKINRMRDPVLYKYYLNATWDLY